MVEGRSRRSNFAPGTGVGGRHSRGFVTVKLPRHVLPKVLASGKTAFYYTVPTKYRKMGCPVPNEPLGTDYAKACGEGGRAETLNGLFDEWNDARKGLPICGDEAPRIGSIDCCSESTGRVGPTSKRSILDRAATMNGTCERFATR